MDVLVEISVDIALELLVDANVSTDNLIEDSTDIAVDISTEVTPAPPPVNWSTFSANNWTFVTVLFKLLSKLLVFRVISLAGVIVFDKTAFLLVAIIVTLSAPGAPKSSVLNFTFVPSNIYALEIPYTCKEPLRYTNTFNPASVAVNPLGNAKSVCPLVAAYSLLAILLINWSLSLRFLYPPRASYTSWVAAAPITFTATDVTTGALVALVITILNWINLAFGDIIFLVSPETATYVAALHATSVFPVLV